MVRIVCVLVEVCLVVVKSIHISSFWFVVRMAGVAPANAPSFTFATSLHSCLSYATPFRVVGLPEPFPTLSGRCAFHYNRYWYFGLLYIALQLLPRIGTRYVGVVAILELYRHTHRVSGLFSAIVSHFAPPCISRSTLHTP